MKPIFRIEKIKIHNENMDFVGTKTKIKIFGKTVFTISYPIHNKQFKSNLNTI